MSSTSTGIRTLFSKAMFVASGSRSKSVDATKGVETKKDALHTVMASPVKLLVAAYLVIGLDEISFLCMVFAYFAMQGCGLFDSIRARLDGPKATSAKFTKKGQSAPPHHLLVGAMLLFGTSRLIGQPPRLLGMDEIADTLFILGAAFAYLQWRATKSNPNDKVARPPVGSQPVCRTNQWWHSTAAKSTLRNGGVSLGGTPKLCRDVPPVVDLAEELDAFVANSLPQDSDKVILQKMTSLAKESIGKIVPEADIATITYVNLQASRTNNETPVHELDCHMVVTCDPQVLSSRLVEHFMKAAPAHRKCVDKLSGAELRKCATKFLAKKLTFVRFWRSQFGGLDPMAVYMVPEHFSGSRNQIRLHFIVNCPYHLRSASVLSQADLRTKELIVFTNEWAKRRGLVNITKGHAHSYAWCLMALYFMRFEARQTQKLANTVEAFMQYLMKALSDQETALSMCFNPGARGGNADSISQVWCLPYIQDPFDSMQNVADTITIEGIARVREELVRASTILSRKGASLVELMERYIGDVAPQGSNVE